MLGLAQRPAVVARPPVPPARSGGKGWPRNSQSQEEKKEEREKALRIERSASARAQCLGLAILPGGRGNELPPRGFPFSWGNLGFLECLFLPETWGGVDDWRHLHCTQGPGRHRKGGGFLVGLWGLLYRADRYSAKGSTNERFFVENRMVRNDQKRRNLVKLCLGNS